MNKSSQLRWLWLSWLVLIIDQTTKWIALRHLGFNKPVVLTSFFNLTLEFNNGSAFGFLNMPGDWQRWLFSFIALSIIAIIFSWLKKLSADQRMLAIALSLILGGAVGNLVDRLFHGNVVDFISWHIGQYYWPTFNMADSAVCLGAFLLILGWGKHDKKQF